MPTADFYQYGAHIRRFSDKTNDSILNYYRKSPILGHFGHFLPNLGQTRILPKTPALSLFYVYYPLTSCKKSSKTAERFRRYSNLKNRTIWLAESFRPYNLRTRFFPDMGLGPSDVNQIINMNSNQNLNKKKNGSININGYNMLIKFNNRSIFFQEPPLR